MSKRKIILPTEDENIINIADIALDYEDYEGFIIAQINDRLVGFITLVDDYWYFHTTFRTFHNNSYLPSLIEEIMEEFPTIELYISEE